MNNVKINVLGLCHVKNTIIYIDGKKILLKKNNFGNYEINYQTDNDFIDLEIYKQLEINEPLWFILGIFYFLISLFGILSPRYEKCIVVDCRYKFKVDMETKIKISFINANDKTVQLESSNEYNIIKNEFSNDNRAKKRLRILLLAKILLWILFIILIIYFIINH